MKKLIVTFLRKKVSVSTMLILISMFIIGPVSCIGASIVIFATDVLYDPQTSKLPVNNVQEAIDVLNEIVYNQGKASENLTGPSGPSGAMGPSGPQGKGGNFKTIVKDINDNFIGYLFDKNDEIYYIHIPGFNLGFFEFSAKTGYFYRTSGYVYYKQLDCQGDAYLDGYYANYIIDLSGDVLYPDLFSPSFVNYFSILDNYKCYNLLPDGDNKSLYLAITIGKFPYAYPLSIPFQMEIVE